MSLEIKITSTFRRSFKKYHKKYKNIANDLEQLCAELKGNPAMGDAIPELNQLAWKIRMKCTDLKKGKRDGFRIIYFYDETHMGQIKPNGWTVGLVMCISTQKHMHNYSP